MVIDFGNLTVNATNKAPADMSFEQLMAHAANTSFQPNSSLRSLVFKNLKADKVEILYFSLHGSQIEYVEFDNCNFDSAENVSRLFSGGDKLVDVIVNGERVTGDESMLGRTSKTSGLFPNATDASSLFVNCPKIKHLNLEPLFGANCMLKNYDDMLLNMQNLQTVNFGSLHLMPQVGRRKRSLFLRSFEDNSFFGAWNHGIQYHTFASDQTTRDIIRDKMETSQKNINTIKKIFTDQESLKEFLNNISEYCCEEMTNKQK